MILINNYFFFFLKMQRKKLFVCVVVDCLAMCCFATTVVFVASYFVASYLTNFPGSVPLLSASRAPYPSYQFWAICTITFSISGGSILRTSVFQFSGYAFSFTMNSLESSVGEFFGEVV